MTRWPFAGWAAVCLGLLSCGSLLVSSAVTSTPLDPRTAADRITSFVVHNRRQCHRLCWYVAACVRYCHDDRAGDDGGNNCVLHASAGRGEDLLGGWREHRASAQGLPPNHSCLSRHCGQTEVCIPGLPRDNRSLCGVLIDFNNCNSSPCENGGTCVDQDNAYTCNCPAGYSGQHCQTEINECSSSPCEKGGTCVDQDNAYTCNCPAGYSGQHCQTDINECSSGPCENGGTCVDQDNAYTCNCSAGYSGQHCQTEAWLAINCTGSSDCVWNMTDCFSGECLCKDGYFFSHSQYACVTNCSAFHSSYYSVYHKYDYTNNDTERSNGVSDVQQCQAICSADPQCLLFAVVPARGNCYYKNDTPQGFLEYWIYRSHVDTHQKTCV